MAAGGWVLRDLLSSAVQRWVDVHLHPPPPAPPGRPTGRRPSWTVQHHSGDNALHFADLLDDDDDDDDFADSAFVIVPDCSDSTSHWHNHHDHYHNNNNGDRDDRRLQTQRPATTGTNAAEHARTRMHMLPDQMREEETVDTLVGLMGEGFDREVARRVLRKYDGNVDKAAGALLEGEHGEELVGPSGPSGPSTGSTHHTTVVPQAGDGPSSALGGRPNTPVIDLTFDDDQDLQRAMQESMSTLHATTGSAAGSQAYAPSTSQNGQGQTLGQMQGSSSQPEGPVFGPSEHPSDPNWAIVPSNQNESSDVNYFHNLNRAIKASLETMGDSDALEPFPVEQQLRRDGCPVVLRPSMHTMVYATSILQGLFYVPQVRERMACWRPPIEDEASPFVNDPDYTLWALSEIFTHMDLARLCDLNVDKRLPAFDIEPWDRPALSPGGLSQKFLAKLSATLEKAFVDQFARDGQPLPKPRLLHFQYGSGISEPGEVLQETSIVPIDVNGGESNDLIGRLSAQLSKPLSEPGKQSVIFEPSEVVAFELIRSLPAASTSAAGVGIDRKPFTYPKSIYLDQFLRDNVALAQAKREQRQAMLDEVQRLVRHKDALTHFDGKDTLSNLRSAIFYFENVANAEDDLERGASILTTSQKLKAILATIQEEIKAVDEKINTLRSRADTLLDCEELQQLKYDLRVVFVHDGLYGRKHLYSYVHDKACWWKIADSLIEKVPEEVVLHETAGLHLGAGPYLLLYSRAIPESEGPPAALPWMDDIKDDVKVANREFLSQLPPQLVEDIVIDEEDTLFSSIAVSDPAVVQKDGGRDRMDVS